MMQIDRLIRAIREMKNPTAMGLDTSWEHLPRSFTQRHIEEGNEPYLAIAEYNEALLRGLCDIVPCVKIQMAYYEQLGYGGDICLSRTIDEATRLGYVVILDAKRGDIGPTAAAYANAYLAEGAVHAVDFLTVNPYLGYDGIEPFLNDCEKTGRGIFTLVKTSNPSGGEFQDLRIQDGRALYEAVGDRVSQWGEKFIGEAGYSSVAAVVGATYPEQGAALRRRMPHTFFLLPGYGAQGASAADLAGCFDASGGGAIVAASRSIIYAYKKSGTDDFIEAARKEAIAMRDALGKVVSP